MFRSSPTQLGMSRSLPTRLGDVTFRAYSTRDVTFRTYWLGMCHVPLLLERDSQVSPNLGSVKPRVENVTLPSRVGAEHDRCRGDVSMNVTYRTES